MNKKSAPLDTDLIAALAGASLPAAVDAGMAARVRGQLFQRVHAAAPGYLFVHSHEGEWVNVLQGVDLKLLRQDDMSRSFLLRLMPGARVPPHDHALDEESLVLEGDATINGVLCLVGDYHMAPRNKPHGWISSENGCLLFIRGAAHRPAADS